MRSELFRALAFAAALLMLALPLLAACSGSGTEGSGGSAGEPADTSGLPESGKLSLLRVSSKGRIVDGVGNEVKLHGVNLGGWLIQETWMCAVSGSECSLDSIELLEKRGFSEEQIKTLFMTYADNYIKEKDIKALSSLGVNLIRLPFWYRNFMDSSLEFYTDDDGGNPGFILIDRLLSWAKKYDMYVVLDLHGAPGGQSTDHCCGTIGKNQLYTDEKNLSAMQRLWEKIASRYKSDPTVAAYDIMNEPMNNSSQYENGWAAGSPEAVEKTVAVYDRMIKAIRAVDPDHMITVEGIWSTDALPDPSEYGWTNMIYQLHLYDSTKEMIDHRVSELDSVRRRYNVAVYVGEFNNGDSLQDYAYSQYVKYDIPFTMWTYKVSKNYLGNWGLYGSDVDPADLSKDSFEEIKRKWSSPLDTEYFTENTTVKGFLLKYCSGQ